MLSPWRVALTVAAALGAACHLGDLVNPEAPVIDTRDTTGTDTTHVIVRSLILAPADTTLTVPGDSVCLRWTARDSAGAVVPEVTPLFTLTSNPAGRLALTATPGCVVALSVGSQGAGRVQAAVDSATADAFVRANP